MRCEALAGRRAAGEDEGGKVEQESKGKEQEYAGRQKRDSLLAADLLPRRHEEN